MKSYMHPPLYKHMEEFGQVLDSCGLADLGFWGYPFTWNNKRPGTANTRQRLDRVVANVVWKGKFQDCTITHLASHATNHLPLPMQTRSDKEVRVMVHVDLNLKNHGYCGMIVREQLKKHGIREGRKNWL